MKISITSSQGDEKRTNPVFNSRFKTTAVLFRNDKIVS